MKKIYYIIPIALILLVVGILIGVNIMPQPEPTVTYIQEVNHEVSEKEISLHQANFNKATGQVNWVKEKYKVDFSDDGTGDLFKFYDLSETYWVGYEFDLIQTKEKETKTKEKEWKLKNDLGYKNNTNKTITYEEQDIEIRYYAYGDQLKEDIYIEKDNKFKPTDKNKNYTFEVRGKLTYSNGLTPKIDGSGRLTLSDETITRFTFPRPFIIDSNNTTVYLDYELNDNNLSVVINYEEIENLTYPITLDPSVVAGCTETSTEIQCHDGTYVGNWINTTKNISIQNATIDGTATNTAGDIILRSYGNGWIEVLDSTINGYGRGTNAGNGNSGHNGYVFIQTNGTFFINNSVFNGYGSQGTGSVSKRFESGGQCDAFVGRYHAYTGTNTWNCYGVAGQNSVTFGNHGGFSNCDLHINNGSEYGTYYAEGSNTWNCYGGTGGQASSGGAIGGNGGYTTGLQRIARFETTGSPQSWNMYGGKGGLSGTPAISGTGGSGTCTWEIFDETEMNNIDINCRGGDSGRASVSQTQGNGGVGTLTMTAQNHTITNSAWNSQGGCQDRQPTGCGVTNTWASSNLKITADSEINFQSGNSLNFYTSTTQNSYINLSGTGEKTRLGLFGLSTSTFNPSYNATVYRSSQELLVGNYTTQNLNFNQAPTLVGDEQYYLLVDIQEPEDLVGSLTVPVRLIPDNLSAPLNYCEFNITYQNGTLAQANTEINNCLNTTGTVPTEDDYRIDVFINDTQGFNAYNNKNFSLDTTNPTVELNAPTTQGAFAIPYNITITYNITDPNINKCYWNASGEAGGELNCSETTFNVPMTHASQINISINASDLVNNSAYNMSSVEVILVNATQWTDKTTVTEGDTATFYLNVTSEDIPTTTASLFYNNTEYPADGVDKVDSDNYAFDKALTIPVGSGNVSGLPQTWFWQFNIGSGAIIYNMTSDTQTVFAVDIDDCTLYNDVIANYTLKDEETNTILTNATGSSIEVDWTLSSWIDPTVYWTYHTETTNKTLLLCVPTGILNDSTFKIDAVASYVTDTRVQEFWYLDNGTLDDTTDYNDHTTHNIELRDLLTVDSTTFLFTFVNEFNIEEEGIIVHVDRYYIGDGTFREVERAKSDDNGETHVHLVQEDVIYRFRISKDSEITFTSENYNAKCLSQPCQITLSAIGELGRFDDDFNRLDEGTYSITDDDITREVELTFNLEEIDTMNLTVWKYSNVINSPDEIVATDTVTAKTGTVTVTVPASAGNQTYYATVQKGSAEPELVTSRWVDFSTRGFQFLGTTGILIAFLLVLTLGLMAVSSGAWTIMFVIIALIISSILKILDMNIYLLMYIITAGLILIYKLTRRKSLD